jgi:hypothetical protein
MCCADTRINESVQQQQQQLNQMSEDLQEIQGLLLIDGGADMTQNTEENE